MISRPLRLVAALAFASLLGCETTAAADMAPYRARYSLSLVSSDGSSGVVGAGGALLDEWNRTCDGWTEQEHFYLHLDYGEDSDQQSDLDSYSSLVSWEASDGSRFRFDMRRSSSDEPYEEIRGEAKLTRPGAGGIVVFERPKPTTLQLPRGALFPAADTRFLIARAEAGDRFVGSRVFDGSDLDNAGEVTAVIGPRLAPGAVAKVGAPHAALLDRPSWKIRLAFFPTNPEAVTPDYEESVRLLDNGVLADMVFDYGDYRIPAKLEQIDALPGPHC